MSLTIQLWFGQFSLITQYPIFTYIMSLFYPKHSLGNITNRYLKSKSVFLVTSGGQMLQTKIITFQNDSYTGYTVYLLAIPVTIQFIVISLGLRDLI